MYVHLFGYMCLDLLQINFVLGPFVWNCDETGSHFAKFWVDTEIVARCPIPNAYYRCWIKKLLQSILMKVIARFF